MITSTMIRDAMLAVSGARREESGPDGLIEALDRLAVDSHATARSALQCAEAYLSSGNFDVTDHDQLVGLVSCVFIEGFELGVRAARRETP